MYNTSTPTCIKNFSEEHKKKQESTPELLDKQRFFSQILS